MRLHRLWKACAAWTFLSLINASLSSAAVTYIDASVTNTVGAASGLVDWNSGTDMPPTTGALAADGLWRFRADQGYDAATNSQNGGIWEASGSNTTIEDAVELKTTIGGLANGLYKIYVFFDSSTGGDWPIRAGLTSNPGANQIYAQGATPGAIPGYSVADPVFGLTFNGPTPASQAENVLYALLGEVDITNGSFSVFVDDLPATSSSNRSWYEGVGYELATSGPTIITSVMSGLASSASTWSNSQPPSSANDYHVLDTHTVTVNAPFDGHELRIKSGGVVDVSADAVYVPLIIVESGANLTESVSGDFALGDITQPTLGTLQLDQDLSFNIDPASDFFLDMRLTGQGDVDFSSGAGSQLWLSTTQNHLGTIRFDGTGDQVNITEHNQGVGTLEMNSTGANRLVYNPLDQADDGTIIFNQPGTIVHASTATAGTRRLHGPNVLVANAPITIDVTTGYPDSTSPTEERRLLITGALEGSADITVNGTPTDLTSGSVTLNEFEIGGTGEPTGAVVTDPYSGAITANDFVNLEIRHNLPNAGFVINNNARLEMGHQAIPNAKNITFGEIIVNNGGTLDVGFEQGFATATEGYSAGHHAYDLILTSEGGRSGGLTLNDGATLRMQVNGKEANQFDSITAGGDVMLNGTLNVLVNPPGTSGASGSAANSTYAPMIGDTFDIITIAPGLGPVGDYDGDNDVDTDDHVRWMALFGTNDAAADGNQDGVVNAADYVVWRKNVGQTGGTTGAITGTFDNVTITDPNGTFNGFGFQVNYLPTAVQLQVIAGAGALSAVPEPSTALLAALMLTLVATKRRERS
jgi:hypothetical protein